MSEMSTSSDMAKTPNPPATPSLRNGTPVDPPVTPLRAWTPSGREMSQHPTDPSKYITIGIHTAKCDVCNGRNENPDMRRCPECTWQICGVCRENKNDNLAHGNVTPKPMPSKRKKLADISGFGQGRMASPQLEKKSAASASTMKKVENSKATSASTMKQKLLAAKQEATPPRSGEKRRAETMSSQARESSVLPDADDDETEPEPVSPTMSCKRQKFGENSHSIPKFSNGSLEKPNAITPEQKTASYEKTTASLFLKTQAGSDMVDENAKAVAAYFGIPDKIYKEHPLARPLTAPISTVRVPPNVQRNFMPRRGAAEIQRGIQEKVAKKLETGFGWPANHDYASENAKDAQQKTIRDVVNTEVKRVVQESPVDAAQLVTIIQAIEEAALRVRDGAVQAMAAPFRAAVAAGMDMELVHLNDIQAATLRSDVRKASELVLKKTSSTGGVPIKVSDERSKPSPKA